MSAKDGPVLIELDAEGSDPAARGGAGTKPESPATAPPVPDLEPDLLPRPKGGAMQAAVHFAARRPSRLLRWFWSLLGAIIGFAVSLAAWDFVTGLIARNPVLGLVATGLVAAFLVVLVALAIREWAAFARLGRIDGLQRAADRVLAHDGDLDTARGVVTRLKRLYAGRGEMRWALERLAEREGDPVDGDALLMLAERELLSPLDAAALKEIEAASRQVALVTAVVPLALADVATALTANLRMIRRVAEIYGGRAGLFGGWRLTRAVMTHLVATGAVAVGDDLIHSVAGGGVLSKLSRRFGEGIVNGALTARVGVAAMEVCRPLGFRAAQRPSVTGIVRRSLTGLFGK